MHHVFGQEAKQETKQEKRRRFPSLLYSGPGYRRSIESGEQLKKILSEGEPEHASRLILRLAEATNIFRARLKSFTSRPKKETSEVARVMQYLEVGLELLEKHYYGDYVFKMLVQLQSITNDTDPTEAKKVREIAEEAIMKIESFNNMTANLCQKKH